MTVDELINALRNLQKDGYGACKVIVSDLGLDAKDCYPVMRADDAEETVVIC